MYELFLALIFGASISLMVWSVYQVFSEVPDEDRSYMDRPPTAFRLMWPVIKLLVHYIGPKLSRKYRIQTMAKLKRAGVDYSLSPEQFFAGKLLAAMFFAAFTILFQKMLGSGSFFFILLSAAGGFMYPEMWIREAIQKRHKEIFRALPFYLDVVTLSVEAGSNLTGAFTQAVQKAPDGPLKNEINRVLRDVRAGKSRAESLRTMADRIEMSSINSLVSSLIQAEKMGTSLGTILRAQADQRRNERFLAAEKLAMEAPVKLLGPLVMFIFPNTFIVLMFVLLGKAVQQGVVTWGPLLWAMTWPGP